MQHPIFVNKIFIRSYLLITVIFIIIDFLLIYFGQINNWESAILNAVVFDTILFALGGSLWYPVYFHNRKKGIVYRILQLTLIGFIYISIWLVASVTAISIIESLLSIKVSLSNDFLILRFLVGILMYSLFVAVYFLMISFQNEEDHNREKLVLKNMLTDAELSLLKSQLNPHFLFNSLNSISSLTIYDSEKAREMISKLSDFLRYSLRNNDQKLLPLKEELDNLKRYMDIERIRFGEKVLFSENVNKESEDKLLPALIIQPLMENAIKHGVYNSIDPTNIDLKCYIDKGDLVIVLKNSFEDDSSIKKGEGIGLLNTKKRMNKIYGRKDLVQIEKGNDYFKIVLIFPQFLKK